MRRGRLRIQKDGERKFIDSFKYTLIFCRYVCKAKYRTVESHFLNNFSGVEPQRTEFSGILQTFFQTFPILNF